VIEVPDFAEVEGRSGRCGAEVYDAARQLVGPIDNLRVSG
jgi:hypothetical protein